MLRKKYPVITHIVAWLIFLVLPFITLPGPENSNRVQTLLGSPSYWISLLIYLFVFYVNGYVLIPRLYLQKKYVTYTITVLAMLTAGYFARHALDIPRMRFGVMGGGRMSEMQFRDSMLFLMDSALHLRDSLQVPPGGFGQRNMPGGMQPKNFEPERARHIVDLFSIFLLSTIWALSTALRITQKWAETEQRAVKAEADKANAELSFLKAQINPHFLFNTLNNIYSLAVRQHENTADSIMKLSNIMRYVTDDVNRDFVPLQSELDCISDYIDLQRLRLSKKVQVDFTFTGSTEGKRIPPLVLMTFIENVFKYGISSHEQSVITIKLFAEEKNITFFCQNKLFATERKVERTGIGLMNTKQRLDHLYPNRHLLNISSGNGLYTVELTLMV